MDVLYSFAVFATVGAAITKTMRAATGRWRRIIQNQREVRVHPDAVWSETRREQADASQVYILKAGSRWRKGQSLFTWMDHP